MKLFYIVLNLFLAASIYGLAQYHYKYKEEEPDKELKRTPKVDTNAKKPVSTVPIKIIDTKNIVSKNLFTPNRSSGDSTTTTSSTDTAQKSKARKDVEAKYELAGICIFGDLRTAVIIDKSSLKRRNGPPGRRNSRTSQTSTTNNQDDYKAKKRVFKVNDDISNGYTLSAINENSVILDKDGSKIELKMERTRSGEIAKKAAETPKNPTKETSQTALIRALNRIGNNQRSGFQAGFPGGAPPGGGPGGFDQGSSSNFSNNQSGRSTSRNTRSTSNRGSRQR